MKLVRVCALLGCLLGLFFLTVVTRAATATIKDIRLWASPEGTRVVFDLSGPVQHRLFTLHNPERVVIDLPHVDLSVKVEQLDLTQTLLKRLRHGQPKQDHLRIVFDLQEKVSPKSFVLKPNEQYPDRLVVDLGKQVPATAYDKIMAAPVRQAQQMQERDFVIAIDPGHGGEDPGAIGRRGLREKDVVLAIGRRIRNRLNRKSHMKAVLMRDGDYYVGLRQRIAKARISQADLFVSIHADAFKDNRARGASLYTLSAHGASNEAARWLAERENRADLIGGISLDDKDDMLASVLLDLSQTASSEASLQVGRNLLNQLQGITRLHSKRVQQAGFAVLKSPDIPSVLIETGFISNRTEEGQLRTTAYQQKLAMAIVDGLSSYFARKPRPKVSVQQRDPFVQAYRIVPGDTLSELAHRHHTSIQSLQKLNNLHNDRLHVGQLLRLPNRQAS